MRVLHWRQRPRPRSSGAPRGRGRGTRYPARIFRLLALFLGLIVELCYANRKRYVNRESELSALVCGFLEMAAAADRGERDVRNRQYWRGFSVTSPRRPAGCQESSVRMRNNFRSRVIFTISF
jgi:hypothetical protein